MKTLLKVSLIAVLSVLAFHVDAQTTTTQTTTSGALTANSMSNSQVCLVSSTGVSAPSFGNPALTGLMIDREFMVVSAATPSTLCWIVTRGFGGTAAASHASGATVWVGPTGGLGGSPFRNLAPYGGAGSVCSSLSELYLPQIVTSGVGGNDAVGSIWSCPVAAAIVAPNMWVMVQGPVTIGSQASGVKPYYAADTGANNAVTAAIPGLAQVAGVCVLLKLGHTLQAGANTFALNGATAKNIKSSRNVANDIGVAYAATGTVNLCYDGTEYVDTAQ